MDETTLENVPERMRALVLRGKGFENLGMEMVETPRPGPAQLVGRVDAAGICTSLIKLVEQGSDHTLLSGWDVSRYPLILGDEGAVTICRVGTGLAGRYHVGERYVIQPAVDHPPINHRERYRDGGQAVRKTAAGYTLPGHLAEYILIPEEVLEAGCLLPLPDHGIAFAHAATAEPLSCVISAQDHHLHLEQESPICARRAYNGLRPGGVTVIIGSGAMGRMHVDLAMNYRPRAIIVSDLLEERLGRARELFAGRADRLGIKLVINNPADEDLREVTAKLTGSAGADDVIVAVGSREAIALAEELVGRGAVLNLFGGLKKGEDLVPMNTTTIHYREINVTGSSGGSPWDVARTLELMSSGQIDASAHITRIGDLDDAPRFLEMIKRRELDGKAIVYPHRKAREIRAVDRWTREDEQAFLR